MKRTKAWWASLTEHERKRLVWLEGLGKRVTFLRHAPEGTIVECAGCNEEMPYGPGPCAYCRHEQNKIIAKANKASRREAGSD
jgi:hypothetical protein